MPLQDLTEEEEKAVSISRLGPRKIRLQVTALGKPLAKVVLGVVNGSGQDLCDILNLAVWPEGIRLQIADLE